MKGKIEITAEGADVHIGGTIQVYRKEDIFFLVATLGRSLQLILPEDWADFVCYLAEYGGVTPEKSNTIVIPVFEKGD